MQIQKAPYKYDFVDNHPEFVIRTNREDSDGYRLLAWFEVGGETTPDLWFEYSDSRVRLDMGFLKSMFQKPVVPGVGLSYQDIIRCDTAMLPSKLYFAEVNTSSGEYDRTQLATSASAQFYLVNGLLEQYCRDNNIPDWTTSDTSHFYLHTDINIFAQDNGAVKYTDFDVDEYLHISNFTTADITATPVVVVRKKDGTSDTISTSSLTFNKHSLYTIPVSLAAFDYQDIDNAVSYTVSFANNSISRTYIRKDFAWGSHTFLMLDSMNLYETFMVEYIAREEQTEGERRVIANIDSYATSDRQTVYTARCHPRSAAAVNLLRFSFSKQDNLLVDGDYAWRVDMIPGSLTVSDESADLIEIEFSFRLREKINRNPQAITAVEEAVLSTRIIRTDTIFK